MKRIGLPAKYTCADTLKTDPRADTPLQAPCLYPLLVSVFAAQVFAYFGLQLAVVVVDGGPQSSLGGISLGQSLQNALQIAHALGVDDELHGCQRLVVGQNRLHRRKSHEAAFQRVVTEFPVAP